VSTQTLTNLPAQVSSFIGREAELAEVRSLVAGSRLVTLTGVGGAGKTRLALQAAAGLVDGAREGYGSPIWPRCRILIWSQRRWPACWACGRSQAARCWTRY
jgi:hypothetical protein